MKELGLDPKQYKYLKSDDKTTTLQHKKGHTVTIAHSVLSPKNQAILKALSKVGPQDATPDQTEEAKDQKMAEGGQPKEPTIKPANTSRPDTGFGAIIQKAKGGKVDKPIQQDSPGMVSSEQCYDDGGMIDKAEKWFAGSFSTPEPPPSNSVPGPVFPHDEGYPDKKPQKKAEGGEVCENCGHPHRKMYAAPDGIVAPNDNAPTALQAVDTPPPVDLSTPTQVSTTPEMSDQEKLKELYNQNIPGTAMGMQTREDQEMQKIGPDGKPPQQLNMKAWNAAQQQLAQQKNNKIYADQAAQNEALDKNTALTSMGFQPTASGDALPNTVPDNQQPNDSLGQNSPTDVQPSPSGQDDMGQGQYGNMLQQGYNNQLAGIKAGAKAQGDLGKQQADMYQQNIEAQQQAQRAYNDSFQQLSTERQNFISDIQENHINPDQYWDNHSKLAAGIGMILAGFNPTNKPNAAIEYIQHQIDNNLKSQVENMGARKTLLESNLRQFGNIKDALDMTRLMNADIVHNSLLQAQAKAQSPMAKAAAQQAIGQLQQQYAPLQQQFAMRQAMMKMAGGDASPQAVEHLLGYMRIAAPEQAKEMESRYVPGVGLAKVQVPDNVRQNIVAQKDVQSIMGQVLQFAKQNHGSLDPRVRAQGQALINELQSKVRTAEQQGVYKESEAKFMQQTIGDSPASFLANWSTVPRVKELQKIKLNDYNNMLKTYGLPQVPMPQQSNQNTPEAALAWAKANPGPKADQILKKLGHK